MDAKHMPKKRQVGNYVFLTYTFEKASCYNF